MNKGIFRAKKSLAMLIALVMVFSLLPITAAASDYAGHWASGSIERAIEQGWFARSATDTYRPNDGISRAEFVTMVNRMKGYSGEADLSGFTDVKSGDWYYDAFAAAVANGYIVGSGNRLNPTATITRNEAVTIFVRISGLDPTATGADNSYALNSVNDASVIPEWAAPYVSAAVSQGLIAGSGGNFNGGSNITRAETAVLLERLYDDMRVFGFAGEYSVADVGGVTIAAAGITLKNTKIKNNLVIAEAVGDGEVYLSGVEVGGKLDVRGGGMNSIHITESNISEIVITKDEVRVVLSDGSVVTYANVEGSGSAIEIGDGVSVSNVTIAPDAAGTNLVVGGGATIENVVIEAPDSNVTVGDGATVGAVDVQAANTNVSLDGGAKVTDLNVKAENANVSLQNGAAVANVTVAENAAGATISTQEGTSIGTVTLNAVTEVTGQGAIATATINVSNVVIESKPDNVTVASNVEATVDNTTVTGGSSSSGGGGGSGSSGSSDDGGYTAYSVTYQANGGTGTMTAHSAAANTQIALKANGFTAPSKLKFDSWNTAANGSGTKYAAGASVTLTANITLYAQWRLNATIALNGLAGISVTETSSNANTINVNVSGTINYVDNVFTGQAADDFGAASGLSILTTENRPLQNLDNGQFTFVEINLKSILQTLDSSLSAGNIYITQNNEALKVYSAFSGDGVKKKSYDIANFDNEFYVLVKPGAPAKLQVWKGSTEGTDGQELLVINFVTTGLTVNAATGALKLEYDLDTAAGKECASVSGNTVTLSAADGVTIGNGIDITVPSGVTLKVTNTTPISTVVTIGIGRTLTLESGSTLICGEGGVVGDATGSGEVVVEGGAKYQYYDGANTTNFIGGASDTDFDVSLADGTTLTIKKGGTTSKGYGDYEFEFVGNATVNEGKTFELLDGHTLTVGNGTTATEVTVAKGATFKVLGTNDDTYSVTNTLVSVIIKDNATIKVNGTIESYTNAIASAATGNGKLVIKKDDEGNGEATYVQYMVASDQGEAVFISSGGTPAIKLESNASITMTGGNKNSVTDGVAKSGYVMTLSGEAMLTTANDTNGMKFDLVSMLVEDGNKYVIGTDAELTLEAGAILCVNGILEVQGDLVLDGTGAMLGISGAHAHTDEKIILKTTGSITIENSGTNNFYGSDNQKLNDTISITGDDATFAWSNNADGSEDAGAGDDGWLSSDKASGNFDPISPP